MSRELFVGILFLLALALTGYLTILVQGKGAPSGTETFALRVAFAEVAGLKKGDQVRVRGFAVGQVQSLEYSSLGIAANLLLQYEIPPRENYAFTVRSASPLGGSFVDYGPGEGRLVDLSALQGVSKDLFTEIEAVIGENRDSLRQMLNNLDAMTSAATEGHGLAQTVLFNAEVAEDFRSAMQSIREVAETLQVSLGGEDSLLGALLNDPELAQTVRQTFDNAQQLSSDLSAVSQDLRAGRGALGRLLQDEGLATDLSTMIEEIGKSATSFQEFMTELRGGSGILARLMQDEAWATSFASALRNVEEITAKINSGEGSIAQLLNDQALYQEAARLVALLRETTEDAREQAPVNTFLNVLFAGF